MINKLTKLILVALLVCIFPINASAASNNIEITNQTVKAKGYLKKKYRVMEFNFHNPSNSEISISDLDFSSDRDVDIASRDAEENSGKSALASTWATAALFWWVFLAPVAYAIIATPIILIRRSTTRGKTRKELAKFSELKPRNLKVKPGETEQIIATFPKNFTKTKLTFKYYSKLVGNQSFNKEYALRAINRK
ncbi:MAG: hypothetical protein HRT47_00455 [Candidatus Caenarcaniphilales bacterium]|nr:hypothetical protein [Candidatus Caenarcaniphilales bacterium]